MVDYDFSPEERRFLLAIGDAGLVAFHPRQDKVIRRMLDLGLADAEPVEQRNSAPAAHQERL
jgi:hypothetical protein